MMFCMKCGFKNPDNAQFCTQCGQKLERNTGTKEKGKKSRKKGGTGEKTGNGQEAVSGGHAETMYSPQEEKQLAQLVSELRNENRQAVGKDGWYIYSLMSAIPFGGATFFAVKRKDKNVNKSSFARAGLTVNLILSFITAAVCIALCVCAMQMFR